MSKKDRNFLEAFMEGAEASVDLMIDNEAIKAVPVVGTAFKLAKGLDDIRSRVLIAKIEKFINDPSLRSASGAGKLKEKILGDANEQMKVGEALFLVLERVTDLEKPAILAKLYVAYLDRKLRKDSLLRLIHCVDQAYMSDLTEFLRSEPRGTQDWRANLVSLGLSRPSKRYDFDPSWQEDPFFQDTSLALELRTAIQHADHVAQLLRL